MLDSVDFAKIHHVDVENAGEKNLYLLQRIIDFFLLVLLASALLSSYVYVKMLHIYIKYLILKEFYLLRKPEFRAPSFGAAAADVGPGFGGFTTVAPTTTTTFSIESVTVSVDERFVCRTENGRKCKESFEYNDKYYT